MNLVSGCRWHHSTFVYVEHNRHEAPYYVRLFQDGVNLRISEDVLNILIPYKAANFLN